MRVIEFDKATSSDIDYLIAEKVYNIDCKPKGEIEIADAITSSFVDKFYDFDKNCWIYTFRWNGNDYSLPWTPMKHIDFAYHIYATRDGKEYANDIEMYISNYRKPVSPYSTFIALAYDAAEKVNLFERIIVVKEKNSNSWSAFQRGLEIIESKSYSFLEQVHILTADSLPETICRAIIYFEDAKNESTSDDHQQGDRQLSKTGA